MHGNKKLPTVSANVKKKMTKEQVQLAIIKKRTCDAKALDIVVKLLEPQVDPTWLIENLQHLNKCHMEDIIEERAISKLCGYVLCQKPITTVFNQRYHISLKNKKVYDVTKRKNFCSSSCFGASNYLLEQMLTSPLWLRDKEEIPTFKIFNNSTKISHSDEIDINIIKPCSEGNHDNKQDNDMSSVCADDSNDVESAQEMISKNSTEEKIDGNIQDFVLETIKNININNENLAKENNVSDNGNSVKSKVISKKSEVVTTVIPEGELLEETEDFIQKSKSECSCENKNKYENTNTIEQHVHFVNCDKYNVKDFSTDKTGRILKDAVNSRNSIGSEQIPNSEIDKSIKKTHDTVVKCSRNDSKSNVVKELNLSIQSDNQNSNKLKHNKNKKKSINKAPMNIHLATRVEQSFQEWFTEETTNFLFGDDSIKQIEKIERQVKYSLLCKKLNKLQFEDQSDGIEVIQKPDLKPAPHFAVLKEEGEKLEIKVRAFYKGNTTIQEPEKPTVIEEITETTSETFLPLTEAHAPQILRRKVFLEKLDQVLPDLLHTLAGNNDTYARASVNYTSVKCTTVKALVYTFSLSPKNIIFKTAEWTLVGLVIIKMLSLLDPWLANLLLSKQANMYISMILTSYKLNPDYLNLLVASFNPNVNAK